MVKIYCLADPRNGKPFYVGATRSELGTRLSGHICEANMWKRLKPMYQNGPSTSKGANCYEPFFHKMFILQGFQLLQKPNAFNYHGWSTNSRFNKPEYKQIKKYSKITYKNILIIIW